MICSSTVSISSPAAPTTGDVRRAAGSGAKASRAPRIRVFREAKAVIAVVTDFNVFIPFELMMNLLNRDSARIDIRWVIMI